MTRNHARRNHYDRVKDSRPNYHLLTSNVVGKVLFSGKTATGVCYLSTTSTATTCSSNVYATKEVILAAGGFGTPKILQLSGIGRKKLLKQFGISLITDLPGVGQNLQDQPTLSVPYTCKSTYPVRDLARSPPSTDLTTPFTSSHQQRCSQLRLPPNQRHLQRRAARPLRLVPAERLHPRQQS